MGDASTESWSSDNASITNAPTMTIDPIALQKVITAPNIKSIRNTKTVVNKPVTEVTIAPHEARSIMVPVIKAAPDIAAPRIVNVVARSFGKENSSRPKCCSRGKATQRSVIVHKPIIDVQKLDSSPYGGGYIASLYSSIRGVDSEEAKGGICGSSVNAS